ncbi:hypothetical protein [Streptomyces sp. NPDC054784]
MAVMHSNGAAAPSTPDLSPLLDPAFREDVADSVAVADSPVMASLIESIGVDAVREIVTRSLTLFASRNQLATGGAA